MQSDSTLQLLVSTQYLAQGVTIQSILSSVVIWAEKNKTLLYTNVMPHVFKKTNNEIKHLLNFANKNNWIYRDEINNRTRPYNHHDIKHRFIRVFLHLHSSSKDAILNSIRTNNGLTDANKCACIREVYDHELKRATQSQYTDDFDIPWMQEFKTKKQLLVNLYNTVKHLDQNNLSYLMFWSSEWQAKRDFWTTISKYACGPAHALTYIKTPSQHDRENVQLCAYHCTYDNKLLQPEKGFLFQELEKLSQDDYTNIVKHVCRLGVDSYIEKNSRIRTMSVNEQKCFDVIKSDMIMKMERESTKFLEMHQDISYHEDPPLMPNSNCNLQIESMFMTGMPRKNTSGRNHAAWAERERQGQNNLSREEQAYRRTWYQEETERRGGEMHADLGYRKRRNAHSKYSKGGSSYGPAYSGLSQKELEETPTVDNGPSDNTIADNSKEISAEKQKLNEEQQMLKTIEARKTFELKKYHSIEAEMRAYFRGFDAKMKLENLENTNIWKRLQEEYQREKENQNRKRNQDDNNKENIWERAFAKHPCAWLAKYDIGFKLLGQYRTQTITSYTDLGKCKEKIARSEKKLACLRAEALYIANSNEQDRKSKTDFAKKDLSEKAVQIKKDINAWKNKIDDANIIEFIKCGVEAVRKMYEETIPWELYEYLKAIQDSLVDNELEKAEKLFYQIKDMNELNFAIEIFKKKDDYQSLQELQTCYEEIKGQKLTHRREEEEAISTCGQYQIVTIIRLTFHLSKMFALYPKVLLTDIDDMLTRIRDFQNTCNERYHRVQPQFLILLNLSLELSNKAESTKKMIDLKQKKLDEIQKKIKEKEDDFEFSIAQCLNSEIDWVQLKSESALTRKFMKLRHENLDPINDDVTNFLKDLIDKQYTLQLNTEHKLPQCNKTKHLSDAKNYLSQIWRNIAEMLTKMAQISKDFDIYTKKLDKLPANEQEFMAEPILDEKNVIKKMNEILIDVQKQKFDAYSLNPHIRNWLDRLKTNIQESNELTAELLYKCWQIDYKCQYDLKKPPTNDEESDENWDTEISHDISTKYAEYQTKFKKIRERIQTREIKLLPTMNLFYLTENLVNRKWYTRLVPYFSLIFPEILDADCQVIKQVIISDEEVAYSASSNPFFLFFDPI